MCQCQELGKGKEGSGALEVIEAGARCLETPDSLERLFLCRAVVLCCFPPLRAFGVLRTERTWGSPQLQPGISQGTLTGCNVCLHSKGKKGNLGFTEQVWRLESLARCEVLWHVLSVLHAMVVNCCVWVNSQWKQIKSSWQSFRLLYHSFFFFL